MKRLTKTLLPLAIAAVAVVAVAPVQSASAVKIQLDQSLMGSAHNNDGNYATEIETDLISSKKLLELADTQPSGGPTRAAIAAVVFDRVRAKTDVREDL